MRASKLLSLVGFGVSLSLAACTGGEAAPAEEAAVATPAPAAVAAPAAQVEPTGRVIEVKMATDAKGNYFEPAEVDAKRGDTVRFVLESGVHNVSFPADKNASATGLPAASPYLQQPGQVHDVVVDLAPGSYTFQCDPHVPMGMVGTLNVQ